MIAAAKAELTTTLEELSSTKKQLNAAHEEALAKDNTIIELEAIIQKYQDKSIDV